MRPCSVLGLLLEPGTSTMEVAHRPWYSYAPEESSILPLFPWNDCKDHLPSHLLIFRTILINHLDKDTHHV